MYNTDIPSRAELPSKRQLMRSTGIAMAIAAALLVTVVLPAEYGLDPTGIGQTLRLTEMGKIKTSLAVEAEADKLAVIQPPVVTASTPTTSISTTTPTAAVAQASTRTDEMSVTLKPGASTEVKMLMNKGAKVSYTWQVNGGLVNHDTHGDPLNGPANVYHGYSKAKQVGGDSGEITAVFDGNHGWFWRNRGDADVTVTLKTTGQYQSIKKMM